MRNTALLRIRRIYYSQQVFLKEQLTNSRALQLMEDLHLHKNTKFINLNEKKEIIGRALDAYNKIAESKDVSVITTFANLCFDYNRTETLNLIWNDIKNIQNDNTTIDHTTFPYELLFKCSLKSNDINKCMQLLQWIEKSKYILHINDSFITKLIIKCSNSDDRIKDLKLIEKLIKSEKLIECDHYEYIDTALINAYCKCHSVKDALNVFNSVCSDKKDIFYIGSMMKAFIYNEHYKQALDLYFNESVIEMDDLCHCMCLKACSRINSIDCYEKGKHIYSEIQNTKIPNIHIKTAMIDLYCNYKEMNKAMDIFNSMEECNIITINVLMTGYINNGLYTQCIELYDQMLHLYNKKKNEISHILAIKSCANSSSNDLIFFEKGKQIHCDLSDILLNEKNDTIKIKTALIDFYGHFGDIEGALNVFNSIKIGKNKKNKKDIICISSLMTAYTHNALYHQCLQLYDKLNEYERDAIIYNLGLVACSNLLDHEKGMQIHDEIEKNKCINQQLINTLIIFYGRCGDIESASNLYNSNSFNNNETKDVISLNVMMTAYIDNKCYDEAIKLYDAALHSKKDETSHVLAIKICAILREEEKGRLLHEKIGNCNKHIHCQNALMDFYGKFNDIHNAENIFNSIEDKRKTIVTVGTFLNVLVNNGLNERALYIYDNINKNYGLFINNVCYTVALKACSQSNNLSKGIEIHRQIKESQFNTNIKIKTTLIDFYGNMNDIASAENIFNSIQKYDIDMVTVNALMNAYCINGLNAKCVEIFKKYSKFLQAETATFVIVLSACVEGNFIEFGQYVDKELINNKDNIILNNVCIQIALMNMYGRFGMIEKCKQLFDEIGEDDKRKEIAIWNAMIHCYSLSGDLNEVHELYNTMRNEVGPRPDRITYGLLLNACSHTGNIKYGIDLMKNIPQNNKNNNSYNTDSNIISCLIDGLSRSGLLFEAYEFIKYFESNTKTNKPAMYMSLLSGSKTHKNKLIGQYIFDEIKLKWNDDYNLMTAATVLLANIYTEYNQFDVANNLHDSLN